MKAPKYWFDFIIAFIWIPKLLQLVFEMWVRTRSKALLLLDSLVKFAGSSLTVCIVLAGWFVVIRSFSRVNVSLSFSSPSFQRFAVRTSKRIEDISIKGSGSK